MNRIDRRGSLIVGIDGLVGFRQVWVGEEGRSQNFCPAFVISVFPSVSSFCFSDVLLIIL